MSERDPAVEIALADALYDASTHSDHAERVAAQIAIMSNPDALAHLEKVFAEMPHLDSSERVMFCARVMRRARDQVRPATCGPF